MPTFVELQDRLRDLKFRRSILLHLMEHIDESFRSTAGAPPVKVLLTDDKLPVPPTMFDQVVEDTILAEVGQIDREVTNIISTTMIQAPPPAPPAPVQPSPEPTTNRRRRTERRT